MSGGETIPSPAARSAGALPPAASPFENVRTGVGRLPAAQCLITVRPVTMPSVLWPKRMPYTPSVDGSRPSPITSDRS